MPYSAHNVTCPACNCTLAHQYRDKAGEIPSQQLFTCADCGALHGTCYLGDCPVRLTRWCLTFGPGVDARQKHYDITLLSSAGVDRHHGWYDPHTGLVTQTG